MMGMMRRFAAQQGILISSGGGDIDGAWDIETLTYVSEYDVSTQAGTTTLGMDISPDETYIYVGDYTNSIIYQYEMTTSGDISTMSYTGWSVDLSAYASNLAGFRFAPDGLSMFVATGSTEWIKYTLSTAWRIDTAVFSSTSSTNITASVYDIAFSNDGLSAFASAGATGTHQTLALNSAYGASVTAATSITLYNGGRSIDFSDDGMYYFVGGDPAGSTIYRYPLTSAFDISSLSPSDFDQSNTAVNSYDATLRKIRWNADGTTLYMLGQTNNTVFKFTNQV